MNNSPKIVLAVFLLFVCGAAAIISHQLRSLSAAKQTEDLYRVISSHLKAVRASNYEAAYHHASSRVQHRLTLSEFKKSQHMTFAWLKRTDRVEFGPAEQGQRRASVRVFFIDPRGEVAPCDFALVKEKGRWKISAVKFGSRWPLGTRLRGVKV